MKTGILGTGMVGNAIGTKLIQLGHEVMMGSRTRDNKNAIEWKNGNTPNAYTGLFNDATVFADEIIFNCTHGISSLEMLKTIDKSNLTGKVLIDIANPLDFSKGLSPTLGICNTDSLGEQIQKAYPVLKVVKTLNTMNCQLMVNPGSIAGPHNVFMSGNDSSAKNRVRKLLQSFGWKDQLIINLGDITSARGTEMVLPIWLRLFGIYGNADFNFGIIRQ